MDCVRTSKNSKGEQTTCLFLLIGFQGSQIVCLHGILNSTTFLPLFKISFTQFKLQITRKQGRKKKKKTQLVKGCLVSVSKQQFSIFKQYFKYFHTFFHSHVFPQKFLNNNFQFLNTYTKRVLNFPKRKQEKDFRPSFFLSQAPSKNPKPSH